MNRTTSKSTRTGLQSVIG